MPATQHTGLRDVCATHAAAEEKVRDAEVAEATAESHYQDRCAAETDVRGLAMDPARIAAEGIDPGAVPGMIAAAEKATLRAAVEIAERRKERIACQAHLRECAEGAADKLGVQARERLTAIQARADAARIALREAEAEELALIQDVNDALRPIYGGQRPASFYGVMTRHAA